MLSENSLQAVLILSQKKVKENFQVQHPEIPYNTKSNNTKFCCS